jgi:alpha-galactosidase
MGWNSYDCLGSAATEQDIRQAADVMAEKLRPHGYEYVVIDAGWYYQSRAGADYTKWTMAMDDVGRQVPGPEMVPSSAGGAGFAPLAQYVHSTGLKFGVHLMRGVPRLAVERNLPIEGHTARAADIADKNSVSSWQRMTYGVDVSRPGGQEYYDSIFRQFARWGIDFVKVDDIISPYYEKEIEAINAAISKCGRQIVLSLSPGDHSNVHAAAHCTAHCETYRISRDIWDHWLDVRQQFSRAWDWISYVVPGSWPDLDMLPLGRLAMNHAAGQGPQDRPTRLTGPEQRTMMSLWCIARSPLMMGGHLPSLDEDTLALLTSDEVLAVNQDSSNNRELFRHGGAAVWAADAPGGGHYLAVFNTDDTGPLKVDIPFEWLNLSAPCRIRDLWAGRELGRLTAFSPTIPSHGAGMYLVRA